MKLRINGNSLRLRLTRSEVEQFASTGSYENSIGLAGGRLVYKLKKDAAAASPSAVFSDGMITVSVPPSAADQWAGSDDVGIEADAEGTKIAIEKDFACLTPRPDEDTPDHYPHPAAGTAC
ncbi:MAG: hypothetical protein IPM59_06235 [Chloracidobacterium sp.]|nr:hypothetical protein [Chloracidobacterium sp.]